jgi:hypothetical protein
MAEGDLRIRISWGEEAPELHVRPRIYSCEGLLPSGRRCGKYAGHQEDDGLNLCDTCHRKHQMAIGGRIAEAIRNGQLQVTK